MTTKPPVSQIRAPITKDIQGYLQRQFTELPPEIAKRVQEAFSGILADPQLDELTKIERDARDVERGFTDIARQWNESSLEARNQIAIAADESAELQRMYQAQAEAKEAAGRYSLEEAAKAIEHGTAEPYTLLLKALIKAVAKGDLLTYMPFSEVQTDYGPTGQQRWATPDANYDECYWDDLNTWLADYAPRLSFKFSAPQRGAASVETRQTPSIGITKQQVITAFAGSGLSEAQLSKKMGDRDTKLFKDSCVQEGRPGQKYFSLWNPIVLATGLREKHSAREKSLNDAFDKHDFLLDWREKWIEINDRFKD